MIPRRSLEVTGNSVMRVATNQIIRGFLQTLLNDYSKWASDESYRERRRANAEAVAARELFISVHAKPTPVTSGLALSKNERSESLYY